ncbi:Dabb family protein [Botrimarina mediterranea]|uniref:Stress responsive A/B Barrel Domain protein n=1 Tax=Botrimarina mediterranea TaxID=2528022 RepID=A0A518KDB4_9BACT|nr:Dabb family protein [Botrimarina mediterranea]QDV75778.1 Stress responsive A/B Barrel Domain protein [Botrimarina mediterranea]QDV80375.1 Stress responsive A/B Barrel Domain protein [Planctomycetes bacterium K2D]
MFALRRFALVLALLLVAAPTLAAEQAHMVFFKLNDSSPKSRTHFAGLCHKYLAKIPGITYFSVGALADDLDRDVNDKDFDIALHVVFKDRAAHDVYATHPQHLKLIEVGKPLWSKVRVFDSDLIAPETAAAASEEAAPAEEAAAAGE